MESVPRQALAAYQSMTLPALVGRAAEGSTQAMIGTVIRALGIFAISALLLGEGLLILWASLGGWPGTIPGIWAVLTGAGLWGLIAVEGLLAQLRPAEG